MRTRNPFPSSLLLLPLLLFAGCGRATDPVRPAASGTAQALAEPDSPVAAPSAPGTPGGSDVAPVARIVSPVPSVILMHIFEVGQPATVRWTATDEDGPGPGVKSFRYLVIRDDNPDYFTFLLNPDSLARRDGPEFAGWTEVDGRVDHADLTGLEINYRYVMFLTAFDRRRRYDASFDLNRNGLMFKVSPPFAPAAPAAEDPRSPAHSPHGGGAGAASGQRR